MTIPEWKAGAKALAAFQQATYAAGKSGKAQGRAFSSLKDICKTIKEASAGLGLSHSERWSPLGTDHAILTVTLHHDSGESIESCLPVDVTQKNRSGSREQAQGSAMTYARRYLLLGIYGLANDDEDDDGEATMANASQGKPQAATAPARSVVVPKPQPAETDSAVLTKSAHDNALRIIKTHPAIKEAFIKKFYESRDKIFPDDINLVEHGEFLEAAELAATGNIPF